MSKITKSEQKALRAIFSRINPANFEKGGNCSVMQDYDFPTENAQTPAQIRQQYRLFFNSWIAENIEFLKKQFSL